MQIFLVVLAVSLLTGFAVIAALNKWFKKGGVSKARRAHLATIRRHAPLGPIGGRLGP
jgi:hypothetical protein